MVVRSMKLTKQCLPNYLLHATQTPAVKRTIHIYSPNYSEYYCLNNPNGPLQPERPQQLTN